MVEPIHLNKYHVSSFFQMTSFNIVISLKTLIQSTEILTTVIQISTIIKFHDHESRRAIFKVLYFWKMKFVFLGHRECFGTWGVNIDSYNVVSNYIFKQFKICQLKVIFRLANMNTYEKLFKIRYFDPEFSIVNIFDS